MIILINLFKYDAFIFPSLTESFGLPLVEAARSNKFFVVRYRFKRIWNKKDLILFDPRNKKDIFTKIFYLTTQIKNQIDDKSTIRTQLNIIGKVQEIF